MIERIWHRLKPLHSDPGPIALDLLWYEPDLFLCQASMLPNQAVLSLSIKNPSCSVGELLEMPFCSLLNGMSFFVLIMFVATATIFVLCQYIDLVCHDSTTSTCPICIGAKDAEKLKSLGDCCLIYDVLHSADNPVRYFGSGRAVLRRDDRKAMLETVSVGE